MRILVLGAHGMLGHKVCQVLHKQHLVFGTFRGASLYYWPKGLLTPGCVIFDVDANLRVSVARALRIAKPDVIINCVGIIKQREAAHDPQSCIRVNALFPHELASIVSSHTKIIHISTDCVFSGLSGAPYTEGSCPSAKDTYGLTKFLGELPAPHLTLRTSIIGRELTTKYGLVEWFLAQTGPLQGYTNAKFTGLTTQALAEVIGSILDKDLTGLYHVGVAQISKCDLLIRLNELYKRAVQINPTGFPYINRSLNSERFWEATGLTPPTWDAMLTDLVNDPIPYEAPCSTVNAS